MLIAKPAIDLTVADECGQFLFDATPPPLRVLPLEAVAGLERDDELESLTFGDRVDVYRFIKRIPHRWWLVLWFDDWDSAASGKDSD